MKTSDSIYAFAAKTSIAGMTATQVKTFWRLHRKLRDASWNMLDRLSSTNKRSIAARTSAAEAMAAAAFQIVRIMHDAEKNK